MISNSNFSALTQGLSAFVDGNYRGFNQECQEVFERIYEEFEKSEKITF
jgi:hypothetical protein